MTITGQNFENKNVYQKGISVHQKEKTPKKYTKFKESEEIKIFFFHLKFHFSLAVELSFVSNLQFGISFSEFLFLFGIFIFEISFLYHI